MARDIFVELLWRAPPSHKDNVVRQTASVISVSRVCLLQAYKHDRAGMSVILLESSV
jgi:hypothetical protein